MRLMVEPTIDILVRWTTSRTRRRLGYALPSWSINQVAIAANRLTDRALEGTGSRRYHFAMLAALDDFGPPSQADLGRCTGIDRSDIVGAINAMVKQGFVDRSPHPSDGRRNVVTITAVGKDHLEYLSRLVGDAQNELLRTLSAEESKTMAERRWELGQRRVRGELVGRDRHEDAADDRDAEGATELSGGAVDRGADSGFVGTE